MVGVAGFSTVRSEFESVCDGESELRRWIKLAAATY